MFTLTPFYFIVLWTLLSLEPRLVFDWTECDPGYHQQVW